MTGRRVLITRPESDAEPFARDLRAAGFVPLLAPLMHLSVLAGPPPDLTGVQALAFTSANGVRAFRARQGAFAGPVFAVGEATGAICREAGFGPVRIAGGDVTRLAALMASSLKPEDGSLYHAAGMDVAGDLVGAMAEHGFKVRRERLYEMVSADRLPDAFLEAARTQPLPVLSLFSPRTARLAIALLDREKCARAAFAALCLSPAVAEMAGAARFPTTLIAQEPTRAGMLAALLDWERESTRDEN